MADIYEVTESVTKAYKKHSMSLKKAFRSINTILNFIDGNPKTRKSFRKKGKKALVISGIAAAAAAGGGLAIYMKKHPRPKKDAPEEKDVPDYEVYDEEELDKMVDKALDQFR
ncbi:MAG: hypothetical protein K6G63_10085 [Eubacterium sp.]|nr:hypothetical protein [Eubacterium sp.]